MNTNMKTIVSCLLVIAGCLLCVFGLQIAHFFYKFPAIPGILTVTFWRDTIVFGVIATGGAALTVAGILRLIRSARRSR